MAGEYVFWPLQPFKADQGDRGQMRVVFGGDRRRQRDIVPETLDHGSQTLLLTQSIFPLEAEGQAEEVNLRDVGAVALPVEDAVMLDVSSAV